MKPNRLNRICCIAAAALLLTACGESGSSAAEPKSETTTAALSAETTTDVSGTTTTAAVTTDDSQTAASSETTTDAGSDTTASSAATTTTAASTTGAQQTTTAAVSNEPVAFGNYFRVNQVLPVSCKGTVQAPDGLNLRSEPNTASKKITLIKDGTAVDVEGIVLTGGIRDYSKRWLKVKSGSNEGYMLAEYVNCTCTTKPEELSTENRIALGTIFYYQSMRLILDYQRQGGVPNLKHTNKYDTDGFDQLSPAMTLAKLRESFRRYFAADYPDDFEECYKEKNGYLWVITGYGDNVMLDYVELDRLEKQEPDALTYNVTVHWFNLAEEADFTEFEEMPFRIVYENGSWKTAEMKSLY